MNKIKSTRVRRPIWALAAVISLAAQAQAETITLYRETFNYCTETRGKEAAMEANWVGLVAGYQQAKISNLKVVSYGVVDIGGSVNSNPIGLSQGYGFWFKPVYGLTLLTAEFQFDIGVLKNTKALIHYKQRLSGIDPQGQANKTHLAILVDNIWYISEESVQQQQPGVWESAQLAPGMLTYGTVPYQAGTGPSTPTSFGSPLPSAGTVRAFGVYLDQVNGRVRIDNFMITGLLPSDGSISPAIQGPDFSLCPASSPDRNGGGVSPTPPPDEDDGDTTPDRYVPDPVATPTPTPMTTTAPVEVHATVFKFCAIKEQGAGRQVVVASKARAAIFKKISGTTLVDLRDRALVALLAQRSMPLGSVVNIKRGDYNAEKGVITVVTRQVTKPIRIKLRGAALQAMQRYLAHAAAPTEVSAPLFTDSGSTVHVLHFITQRALCLADLRGMLKARAKEANVVIQGITSRS